MLRYKQTDWKLKRHKQMFKFRITNLGTADQYGNRACLEFGAVNEDLCGLVWQTATELASGGTSARAAFVREVFHELLADLGHLKGYKETADLLAKSVILLDTDSKGDVVSPKQQAAPITFCEKVDQTHIAAEFADVALSKHTTRALAAWMSAQHTYTDLQLLKMHCIINCTMVLNYDKASALLNLGDSSAEPVPYLYNFEADEDAVFVQEWKSSTDALRAAGATEEFANAAIVTANDNDEDNVAACVAAAHIDLTVDTIANLKKKLSPNELQIKPYRFTATFHATRNGSPAAAVVNWHAKHVKDEPYEELFVSVAHKMFAAVLSALESQHIFEDSCVLLVADSNFQNMASGEHAASLFAERGYSMFNHSVEAADKQKPLARHCNTLVANVNRGRRYSNMSAQWKKATPGEQPTVAPKGIIVARSSSKYDVRATCIERETPSRDYKLDHGHITVMVTAKDSDVRWAIFFVLLLCAAVVVGLAIV